jgi:hypothetical protein
MEVKESRTASCVTLHSLHEHNEVSVYLLDLWPDYICIKKNHEPWDGERLI